MGLSVGVDVVNIARIRALSEGVKRKIFHPEELSYAATLTEDVASEYLAGRFAAKEALGKALGCGLARLVPSTLLVGRGLDGRPLFVLTGQAEALVGRSKLALSISHDEPVAVAVVVVSGGFDGPQ